MQFWLFLASALALGSPAAAAHQRVSTAEAMNDIGTQACSRIYATDADRVLACKQEYFSSFPESDAHLFNDGDDEDRNCIAAGGVIAERMPACVDALAALIKTSDEDETLSISSFFYLLGQVSEHCGAETLCEGTPART